jgi:oxygen-dependent protoporphyrinogen oxidase
VYHTVARWPRAMAQYTVGHAARVQEIEARAGAVTGLYLAGNAYHGIGIPDCVKMGRQAASRVL